MSQQDETNVDMQNLQNWQMPEMPLDNTMDDLAEETQSLSLQEQIDDLQKQLSLSQKELQNMKEIASKSQSQYVSLKYDFDMYIQRTQSQQKSQETTLFVQTIKKIIPFVEELRKSIAHIPQDLAQTPLATWINMIYQKMIKQLQDLWVYQLDSMGQTPDDHKHEVVSTQPVESDDQKNTIVQEFDKAYVYKKWDEEHVIQTAKVILWV